MIVEIVLAVAVLVFVAFVFDTVRPRKARARTEYTHDVIIVGGSIAGPCMAKALSQQGRKVLLIERALWEKPDRIVGELLQPGGIMALRRVDMDQCAKSVGVHCTGYKVQNDSKQWVDLPFRSGFSGVSFHFGDFVQALRRNVWETAKANVEMVEGTVNDVLLEVVGGEERAYGVQYTRLADYQVPVQPFTSGPESLPPSTSTEEAPKKKTIMATAPLIVMADGGSSKFKTRLTHFRPAAQYHSHFVGVILKDVEMPFETRGHVFLGNTGPILSYRLDQSEVRLLVDYPGHHLPAPLELQKWLTNDIAPQMSKSMGDGLVRAAADVKNIRSMPIACYPAVAAAVKGVVGIGDFGNQRHPLTGGGMTCAFRDALLLSDALASVSSMRVADPQMMVIAEDEIQRAVLSYNRVRYLHSSCINILSWALYAVFGGPASMRRACFDYFLLGGEAVSGPMDLLSGLNPSPGYLLHHYARVMFYGAFNLLTLSGSYATGTQPSTVKKMLNAISFFISPRRLWGAIYLLAYATYVFAPLSWMELVSIWRAIDPTGTFARRVYMPLERMLIRTLRPTGRPVSL